MERPYEVLRVNMWFINLKSAVINLLFERLISNFLVGLTIPHHRGFVSKSLPNYEFLLSIYRFY